MADEIQAKVHGLPDYREALRSLPSKLRVRALRNALAAGARIVQKDARARTPVLSPTNAARAPYRKPGTVRKAISVRTSKLARRAGDVGVFVNVRPAKAALRGAKSKDDPFYWRFLEFGTSKLPGVGMLQGAAQKLGQALDKFKATIGPQIQRLNARKDAL